MQSAPDLLLYTYTALKSNAGRAVNAAGTGDDDEEGMAALAHYGSRVAAWHIMPSPRHDTLFSVPFKNPPAKRRRRGALHQPRGGQGV